jgi:hypothetical protein
MQPKGGRMVDTVKLNYLIEKSGHTVNECAEHLGITPQSFHNKKSNRSEFKYSEVVKLAKFIGIKVDDRVFFEKKVE